MAAKICYPNAFGLFCRLVLAVLAAEDRRYHENGLAPRVPKSAETESDDVGRDSNASCPQV